jgi:hypothetical protein
LANFSLTWRSPKIEVGVDKRRAILGRLWALGKGWNGRNGKKITGIFTWLTIRAIQVDGR